MLVASPCDILHGLLPSFCSSLFPLSISPHWVSHRLVSVKLPQKKTKNPPTPKRHHVTNKKKNNLPLSQPPKRKHLGPSIKKNTQRKKSESWNRGRGIRWRCKSIFCNQQWIFGLFGTNMGTYCRWSDGGGKLAIGRKVMMRSPKVWLVIFGGGMGVRMRVLAVENLKWGGFKWF